MEKAKEVIKRKSLETIKIMQEQDFPMEVRVALISLCLGVAQGMTEAMKAMEVDIKHIDMLQRIVKIYAEGIDEILKLGVDFNVDNKPSKEQSD